MRIYLALAWKELHELRWFWYAGMALMVVLPLTAQLYEVFGYAVHGRLLVDVTLSLGAAFAVFVAVATTCRDLGDGVETFWRSRPISVASYVGVKFACGLLIVLSVAVAAVVFQMLLMVVLSSNWERVLLRWVFWIDPLNTLAVQGAVMTAMYAVAFLLGAAIAQAVPAVFLSLLVGLMLYFVPVLLPPLAYLDVFEALRQPELHVGGDPAFAQTLPALMVTLLLGAGVVGVLAWLVLERQVRIAVNAHLLGWTVAVMLLLMMSVAAMQVGSNLTPMRIVPLTLNQTHAALELRTDGTDGVVMTASLRPTEVRQTEHGTRSFWGLDVRRLSVADGMATAIEPVFTLPPIGRRPVFEWQHRSSWLHWRADQPDVVRRMGGAGVLVFDLTSGGGEWKSAIVHELDNETIAMFLDLPEYLRPTIQQSVTIDDRTFVVVRMLDRERSGRERGQSLQLIELDVSEADRTRLVAAYELDDTRGMNWQTMQPGLPSGQFLVPEIEGLQMTTPQRVRLHFDRMIAGYRELNWPMLDDEHIVRFSHEHGVEVLRWQVMNRAPGGRGRPTGTQLLSYERIGHRPPTPLERMVGGRVVDQAVQGGFLFVLSTEPQTSMVVFDLREPQRPRKLGHYAVPGESFMSLATSDDGRVILAGRDLHVFDPADW